MNHESRQRAVQNQYAAVAESPLSSNDEAIRAIAHAFGYTEADLASLPPQANMGLSCGNPIAVAGLRPGEVVVDLGCGGGIDVFLAAQRVGPTGKAIGIDMTPEMIERARRNATEMQARNVEFHLASIERLPLPTASVDCILSNCVINLVPDKAQAFREIFRVLKPGGRIALSDIALKQQLPPEVADDLDAYVGCIGGAILISEYQERLREAGFEHIVVSDTGTDLNIYAQAESGGCCSKPTKSDGESGESGALVHDRLADVLNQFDANAYAASVRVHAIKVDGGVSERPKSEAPRGTRVQVFDKPLCCPTGVCGPEVDPTLPRFAADLAWLATSGCRVERYNLAQQPEAFLQDPSVHQVLTADGPECLPLILVNGQIVSRGVYPTRRQLAEWTGCDSIGASLSVLDATNGCCGGSDCC